MSLQLSTSQQSTGLDLDPVVLQLRCLLASDAPPAFKSRFHEGLNMALQARLEVLRSASPHSQASIAPYRLRKAQEFLEANLCSEIRLDDVAAAAGLSPYHFCRQFKRATGSSPLRYVLERRIERAKKLIVETEASLVNIALELGFSSQSHFTSIFRKLAGQTPHRYRELCRH